MILILVRFMQIGRARESWQIYHKALARFMELPALACTSNLHEPHQNKNHSLSVPKLQIRHILKAGHYGLLSKKKTTTVNMDNLVLHIK